MPYRISRTSRTGRKREVQEKDLGRGPCSLILNSLYIIIRTTVSSKSLLLRTPWRGNGKVNGIELEEFATNCYTGRYIPDRRDPV